MKNWILDSEDDLINLDHIEYIGMATIRDEDLDEARYGHTHQVLGINADGESYRLYSGSEDECKDYRNSLVSKLTEDLT